MVRVFERLFGRNEQRAYFVGAGGLCNCTNSAASASETENFNLFMCTAQRCVSNGQPPLAVGTASNDAYFMNASNTCTLARPRRTVRLHFNCVCRTVRM